MSEKTYPRRTVLKGALLGVAAVPVSALLGRAEAAAGGPVDPNEPQAKSLGYVVDATKVDAKANPELQGRPEMRHMPAGSGRQGERRADPVQHLRRPARQRERLVQGVRRAPVNTLWLHA